MKWEPLASAYKKVASTFTRSGSLNFSPALKVLSNTARVRRLRIMTRTSVCPPRAVGFETSTSMTWYGACSYSKNILRLMSIASIRLAIPIVYLLRHLDDLVGGDAEPAEVRVGGMSAYDPDTLVRFV